MIKRTLSVTIRRNLKNGFVNIIYGPRRVGKTNLLRQLTKSLGSKNIIWFNGDTQETRDTLQNTSEVFLSQLVKKTNMIVIDEAQRIPNIGLSLKILIDLFPKKKFFVTGSSSLLLGRGIQEPLTGRAFKYHLYPLSTEELTKNMPPYKQSSLLKDQLIYGGYPYLQNLIRSSEKRAYLKSVIDDYLFRDILELKDLVSPENLRKLAILLAFQIGSEVSLNELSNSLGIDIKTVIRYLTLLKQGFIIFEIGALSKNLRKEVSKSKKYYFWDLGIRNGLIDQFLPIDIRPDLGQLWENFLAVERLKKHHYRNSLRQYYFWRTYEQAEIDWLEVRDQKVTAYEFKWKTAKLHTPKYFKENYKTTVQLISKENYLAFIT